MPAETQVCNCNGVTKAAIGACVAAGKRSAKAVMDATRAGMGCGSCKWLVSELVDWFCGGEVEEDPSVHYYVPCIPLTEARTGQGGPRTRPALGLRRSSARSAAAWRTRRASRRWRRCSARSGTDEYEDERDARFINDRVHGNIQKDGTFSVMPEMPGGVCTPAELKRIAEVAREIQRAAGQADRRPAHRPRRRAEGAAAGRLARSRHAGRLGLGQKLSHLQELHRHRLLPLRSRRQHGPGHARSRSASAASTARQS